MKSVKNTRKGRPPRQASDEISSHILQTALHLFTTQGFASTSIEQVASTSGSGKHTVYRRFESKTDLFLAVMDFQKQQFLKQLTGIDSNKSAPLQALKDSCRKLLELVVTDEVVHFYRMTIAELSLIPEIASTLKCEESPAFDRILNLVSSAQSSGEISSGDKKFITSQLLHVVTGFPLNEILLGSNEFRSHSQRSKYFEKSWTLFLEGVRGT